MALGYLSKALRRADPSPGTAPLAIKPAARTGSPLAEEDQRLHDTPEVTAPTAHVSPLTDAPAPPVAAIPTQETEFAPAPPADPDNLPNAPAPSPVTAHPNRTAPDASDGPKWQSGLKEPETPAVVPPLPSAAPIDAQSAFETEADATPQRPEPPVAPPFADPLSRALEAAKKWVASSPPDTVPRAPDIEDERVQPVTGTPTAERAHLPDVEPIIRTQPDMRAHGPTPRAPTVEIGSIEVEILPPPPAQAPKPAQRSAPAKASPPQVAPFGWRQR